MMSFNVFDWYWLLDSDKNHVYSTAKFGLVSVNDTDYLVWLDKGFEPNIANSIDVVEDILVRIHPVYSATAWQIRAALTQLGWRSAVESAIAAADAGTKDAWAVQQVYHFNNERLIDVSTAIGKTRADRVILFNTASTLTP